MKQAVFAFWDAAPCGERLHLPAATPEGYRAQAAARQRLEPCIDGLARFAETASLDVLEVGVGLGADHQRFAEAGARLTGIDISPSAIAHTRRRLDQLGLSSSLRVADAEALPFPDASFDLVYSWGVIHHTPDTEAAAGEILRVLRPGGHYAVMVYHRWSLVGLMLWLRYGLVQRRSLDHVYAERLESPGTKALTRREARALFPEARVIVALSSGDLLAGGAGQRHTGHLLSFARAIWPRWLIRPLAGPFGLLLMIEGRKPTHQPA